MAPALEFVLPGDPETRTGGYEYDRRMVAGLRTLGWEVRLHLLADRFPSPTRSDLTAAASTFAALPDGARVLVDGLAFGALPEIAALEASRLRLVALVHHPLAAETGLTPGQQQRLWEGERAALATARAVVVTSAETAAALRPYGVSPQRIVVVEPGTDPAPLSRGSSARGGGPVQLLCVGTLTPRKGHDLLLRALAGLRHHDWRLDCAGSATRDLATAAALVERAAALGLLDRVSWRGELGPAAMEAAWDAADLLVSPSRYEGYGMAVAEALAHGLPVVATDVGAVASLVGEEAGLVVPVDDLPALEQALDRLLGDGATRVRLAAGAARARQRLPSWEQACHALAGALREAA
jgi:glycosyltransferase involved in cell wall biosynthesis